MKLARLFVWTLALLCVAAVAVEAQTVRNPTQVVWTPSADHASVTSYQMGFFLAGATDPVQSADLGKPTPNAQNECVATLPSYPIGTTYMAKLRAFAGAVSSDWSAESNPFYRAPAPIPAAPVVR